MSPMKDGRLVPVLTVEEAVIALGEVEVADTEALKMAALVLVATIEGWEE